MEYYNRAICNQEDPHKDRTSLDNDLESKSKKSRKEKSDKLKTLEPLYRLHSARYRYWLTINENCGNPERIKENKEMCVLLEKFSFHSKRKSWIPISQVTQEDMSLTERKLIIIKNIFDALKYITTKKSSLSIHRAKYKIASIYHTIFHKPKKSLSILKKLILPDKKDFLPKLALDNFLEKKKPIGICLFHVGKEEKYQKQYLNFYISLCLELKDFFSIEEIFLEIVKRNYEPTHLKPEFSNVFKAYLSQLSRSSQHQPTTGIGVGIGGSGSGTTGGDSELILKESTSSLKRAYNAYLCSKNFDGDFNEELSNLLIQCYIVFVRSSTKTELEAKDIPLESVLHVCKKKWSKLSRTNSKKLKY